MAVVNPEMYLICSDSSIQQVSIATRYHVFYDTAPRLSLGSGLPAQDCPKLIKESAELWSVVILHTWLDFRASVC